MRVVYRLPTATVFYDFEWEEFVVKFFRGGVYQEGADYFTNDRNDACGTADAFNAASLEALISSL